MNPTVQLLQVLLLANFPSGSTINYYGDKLYLFGDDARTMVIIDSRYHVLDSVRLFDHPDKRIPKAQKTDIESAVIVETKGSKQVVALGSASTSNRKKVLVVPLTAAGESDSSSPVTSRSISEFVDRITKRGITVVNIEGASSVHRGSLVLANRGNTNFPNNHLIVTDANFWNRQKEAELHILPIKSAANGPGFLGLSEVCYVESKDLFLFAFTSEATNNAYDDGAIGGSYIGWVKNAAVKLKQSSMKLDGMLNLSEANIEFKNQKIEGICVERVNGNELLLHLVSDNDNGESKLFKVLLKFNTP